MQFNVLDGFARPPTTVCKSKRSSQKNIVSIRYFKITNNNLVSNIRLLCTHLSPATNISGKTDVSTMKPEESVRRTLLQIIIALLWGIDKRLQILFPSTTLIFSSKSLVTQASKCHGTVDKDCDCTQYEKLSDLSCITIDYPWIPWQTVDRITGVSSVIEFIFHGFVCQIATPRCLWPSLCLLSSVSPRWRQRRPPMLLTLASPRSLLSQDQLRTITLMESIIYTRRADSSTIPVSNGFTSWLCDITWAPSDSTLNGGIFIY